MLNNNVKKEEFMIGHIPSILWGEASPKVFLYVHGQGGNREEASFLASIVCKMGWQVLSFDLPQHGSRAGGAESFDPWHAMPELREILAYAKAQFAHISLYAVSIGAYFSLLSFAKEAFSGCLFLSPVVDMKALIQKMMTQAQVSEERLRLEKEIPTADGAVLSWKYWRFVLEHAIASWNNPTKILYGKEDTLIDLPWVEEFSKRFGCSLTIAEGCPHYFHTKEQLGTLQKWVESTVNDGFCTP